MAAAAAGPPRRDNPAARAALARRRQRAAQNVTTNSTTNVNTPPEVIVDHPPPMVVQKPRPATATTSSSIKKKNNATTTTIQYNNKTTTNTVKVDTTTMDAPIREVVKNSPHRGSSMSPLTQRAFANKKGNSSPTGGATVGDGTLTTMALSQSTPSSPEKKINARSIAAATTSHPSSSPAVEDNPTKNRLIHRYLSPKSNIASSSSSDNPIEEEQPPPYRPPGGTLTLKQRAHRSYGATSPLHHPTSTSTPLATSPNKQTTTTMTYGSPSSSRGVGVRRNNNYYNSPQSMQRGSAAAASSSSPVPQQGDLLAASRKRRATLENRHRIHRQQPPQEQQQQQERPPNVVVSPRHSSPSPTRRREASSSSPNKPQQQLQQPYKSTVIPRRNISPGKKSASPRKIPSPRRFFNTTTTTTTGGGLPPRSQPPSPKQQHQPNTPSPTRSHQQTTPRTSHRTREKSRSPSPPSRRKKTTSPWIENNVGRTSPKPMMSRPPPIQTTSPHHIMDHNGRHSPGVERLSSFLMDSSSVNDISTIADLTIHQEDDDFDESYSAPPVYSSSRRGNHQYNNNYHYPPEMTIIDDDDQATVDEGKLVYMDASCLLSGSSIMLRACSSSSSSNGSTIAAQQKGTQQFENGSYSSSSSFLANACGIGLGREEEVFEISKVDHDHDPPTDELLRHGDTIRLHSTVAQGKALGVWKQKAEDGGTRMELGFWGDGGTAVETWTILSSRPDREVLVGRAAVTAKTNNNPNNRSGGGMHAPVRSGDPVLLRNCHNGGILSINDMGELILRTDSYDNRNKRSMGDPSLLGRLQQHDRLFPTQHETFQLLLSSTPPCPPWVSGSTFDERIFLTGSYILQPRRNQRSAEFESNLFSGSSSQASTISLLELSQRKQRSTDMNLSSKTKEHILIDEVIGSFLGLEGLHIRLKGIKGHTSSLDHFEFQLFDADGINFDVSLRRLVEQILPLSTSYVRVRNFIGSRLPGYEYGQVMQAFCEGLDGLLQDYVQFVALMERQLRKYSQADPLTMKNIYFQITPSLHSMAILEYATKVVCEKKGGALINTLWSLDKRHYMGDVVAKKVLGILLDKASVPYMEMMSSWLETGRLRDPYEEFMIIQSSALAQSVEIDGDAWMALFAINEDHVLEVAVSNEWTKQKILTTGKYWNAVHACHVEFKTHEVLSTSGKIPQLPFNSDSSAIVSYIDSKYQSASRVLVRLMMENFKLMESLQTMKRYFLIDQGDFLIHFLDASEEELLKQSEDVSIGRVQHWLTMAVQQTEAYRDDVHYGVDHTHMHRLIPKGLRCRFSDKSLVTFLDNLHGGIADNEPRTPSRHAYGMMSNKGNTGIEVFELDFPRVPFPISLVLSQQAMGHYKLLFRHLFFTKHVERRLIAVWRDHQLLKKLDSLRGLLGMTFVLRQRMLYFVQNFIYYMTFEVIENNWMEMQSSIDQSGDDRRSPMHKEQTVDDILNVHNDFLQKTLEACLLTNRELIRSLTKLMNTCLLFTDQMKRFMDTTKIVSLR